MIGKKPTNPNKPKIENSNFGPKNGENSLKTASNRQKTDISNIKPNEASRRSSQSSRAKDLLSKYSSFDFNEFEDASSSSQSKSDFFSKMQITRDSVKKNKDRLKMMYDSMVDEDSDSGSDHGESKGQNSCDFGNNEFVLKSNKLLESEILEGGADLEENLFKS